MPSLRRKGRVAALQVLFEKDCANHDTQAMLDWLKEEYDLPDEAMSFARELVAGVLHNLEQLDALIQKYAPSWPVNQLSAVDRNILRLSIYEISVARDVPLKAAINEAVEIAKAFGSDNSPKFINGVLGAISSRDTANKSRQQD